MLALNPFFAWLESTPVAHAVGQSVLLMASLSAVHLLGFALVMGGALLANLRLLGIALPRRPATEITGPASRVIALGLLISVVTGLAMFSWQAHTVVAKGTYQLKMLLLVTAAAYQFTVLRRVSSRATRPALLRGVGAAGLSLWVALGCAGAAFILFE